ncbi:hypothetical protein ACM74R_00365 (plasmid) [Pseudomonas aeruginosa]|uniref:hypothetical protein n=1 Tax=Pseudomonas aeruginosa TaxID=287 RepID=UPI003DA7ADCB
MRIITLVPLAALAVALSGCANKELQETSYSYESKAHSGTVQVVERTDGPSDQCPKFWRDGEPYQPTGLKQMTGFRLKVNLHSGSDSSHGQDLDFVLPSNNGHQVVMKDFQKERSWLLGADTNGLVKTGELFHYPEGFFIRAASPQISDNTISFCLGVDRMYVPQADLNSSTNPLIRLDRLNIRFAGESGEVVRYDFGTVDPIRVTVSAEAL